jgi:hypothetical protein
MAGSSSCLLCDFFPFALTPSPSTSSLRRWTLFTVSGFLRRHLPLHLPFIVLLIVRLLPRLYPSSALHFLPERYTFGTLLRAEKLY